MMESKKIMFVCQSLGNGGAERVVSILSDELVSNGYGIYVLALTGNTKSYDIDKNVNVISPVKRIRAGVLGKIQRILEIRRQIINNHIDTVIAFSHYNAMFTVLAAVGTGVKVIGSERNDPAQIKNRRLTNWLREVLYKKLDALVCQTEDAMHYFPDSIQKKSTIIMNPISGSLPEPYWGEREHKVVTFCRLEKQKNLPLLIDAFAKFHAEYSDYKLEIYGEGSEKDKLIELISQRKLNDSAEVLPFSKEIHLVILKANMFVLPSNYEGLSNSMIESLAIGLPTIVTDCPCGGARMVIQDGINGFIVPVNDLQNLVNRMVYVAENPQKMVDIQRNAINIRNVLSKEKICQEWLRVIDP